MAHFWKEGIGKKGEIKPLKKLRAYPTKLPTYLTGGGVF